MFRWNIVPYFNDRIPIWYINDAHTLIISAQEKKNSSFLLILIILFIYTLNFIFFSFHYFLVYELSLTRENIFSLSSHTIHILYLHIYFFIFYNFSICEHNHNCLNIHYPLLYMLYMIHFKLSYLFLLSPLFFTKTNLIIVSSLPLNPLLYTIYLSLPF